MARLKPINNDSESYTVMMTISINQTMADKIDEEQKRIKARSRSELVRMILNEYFEQEIKET